MEEKKWQKKESLKENVSDFPIKVNEVFDFHNFLKIFLKRTDY
jgi:hypothetical protein